jgi:hypothetical protein
MKPNPATLAEKTLNKEWVRKNIRKAFEITKGCKEVLWNMSCLCRK